MMEAVSRRALCALLGASGVQALFSQLAYAQQWPPVKMVLSWAFTGEESSFVLADEEGFFRNEGLSVRVDRGYGSGDTVTKVASGSYEFGLADLNAVIAFNAKQQATKVISVFQFGDSAPLAILSLPESKITRPSDLVGRKISSPSGDSTRLMFPAFALANKFDPKSIVWIDVSPQLRETLLVQKQVDAISAQVTHVPAIRRLLNGDKNSVAVMKYSDFGLNLLGHAIITTPEFAAKNGDLVRAFLRASVAAIQKSVRDPASAIAALKKRDALVSEDLESERAAANIENVILTDHVRAKGLSNVDPERLEKNARIVTDAFGFPPIDTKALYRPEFLPPRAALQFSQAK